MIKVIFVSYDYLFFFISFVVSYVKRKKNYRVRFSFLKVNMVMGCIVFRFFRFYLKNIRNWLKMLYVFILGKKN